MRVLAGTEAALLRQRGHLLPFAPVFMAIGIGAYFGLRFEPGALAYGMIGLAGALGAAAALRRPGGWSVLGWALALAALGFGLAGLRAHGVAAPVLGFRYYGPVQGRVVALDRSASDALRVTLDRVVLEDVRAERTPGRVRMSLHGAGPEPAPGARVRMVGHLAPPQGPVEPGGFDFRRHAWFQGLGAVGYTRKPVETLPGVGASPAGVRILGVRMAASHRIRAVLPGDVGGFAAAVTTGDRSAMSRPALDALRASNLAHLLAISGLHMGLLAAFAFGALRLAMAAVPPLALRVPARKLAAVGALAAASGYLALAGGNVATERAFVMTTVMLLAIVVDRRALSLRAVAVAALIVLGLRPEALVSPGFQMSFAATTALVAVFGALRDLRIGLGPRWLRPVATVVISSAVAGLATAPVGAAHFNTLSHFGLLANLVSVPLMGLVVIPAAVLALCLAPLGLEAVGLHLMGAGLRWILFVAHRVAGFDGNRGHVPEPGPWVLPLLGLGLLWLILWQGRARLAGLAPAALAFALWAAAERPPVLVADTGGLVGVMTGDGRALSKPRGAGFIAGVWLENDGDAAAQAEAAARWPAGDGALRRIRAGPVEVVHVIGKRAAATLTDCGAGQVVVASVPLVLSGPCEVFDPRRLRRTGSLAIGAGGIVTARQMSGWRLWNGYAAWRRRTPPPAAGPGQ